MLRDLLRLEDMQVGRRDVRTLMRRMGLRALYRKPNTSRKHPQHTMATRPQSNGSNSSQGQCTWDVNSPLL